MERNFLKILADDNCALWAKKRNVYNNFKEKEKWKNLRDGAIIYHLIWGIIFTI